MRTNARLLVIGLFSILTAAQAARGDDEPRSLIVGKVVDEAKQPVAGATIKALGRKEGTSAQSAADGSFRLHLSSPPSEGINTNLLVQGRNDALGFVGVQQTKPAPVEVVLKAPQALAVHVVDGAGKAVADSAVTVLAAHVPVAAGRTDAAGRWTTTIPADAAKAHMWAVYALKGNVGFDYVMSDRDPENAAKHVPAKIELKLVGARTVRIKALDRVGRPVAGVEVGPWLIGMPAHDNHANLSGAANVRLKTDKDGVAVFDWMPAGDKISLCFISHSDRYYAPDRSAYLKEDDQSGELTIRLWPYERLSGRVTHADGKPAADIRVRVRGQGAGDNGFHGSAQTDAEGRYSLQVFAEQAYVLAVAAEQWSAAYRGGLVVRAGKPTDGVDFVLCPVTRVRGRVTVGTDAQPAPDVQVQAVINLGPIPNELKKPGDDTYRQVGMWFSTKTRKDGSYELLLGPGSYELSGPLRTAQAKITIAAQAQPSELVHDFVMPRSEKGPLDGRVVDATGTPVAGAVVEGYYAAPTGRLFRRVKTDAEGKFHVERSLDALVLRARTADGKEAAIVRVPAEQAKVELALRPTLKATGRVLDLAGKPIGGAKLEYGIRIYMGEANRTAFMVACGGAPVADADGKFDLTGLLPGEHYYVSLPVGQHYRHVTEVVPKDATPINLGDLRVNPEPPKPYVPPTPAERANKAFAPSGDPGKQLASLLVEARREYTRPLLLFGRPNDPACIDLQRLFHEHADDDEGKKQSRHTPSSLRWEFELLALDVTRPNVLALADKLAVTSGKPGTPTLAVLNDDGSLAATHALVLNDRKSLDAQALTEFMLKYKLPQRNAERLLTDALTRAKAEDKRVFFIASASWCGPCRKLSRFLDPFKTELNRHFIFVKLDVSRDEHAREVVERFQGDSDGGVPWFAILDADGKTLITSNVPEVKRLGKPANMGFPTELPEIEHFMKMLTQTAPRLSARPVAEMREALLKR